MACLSSLVGLTPMLLSLSSWLSWCARQAMKMEQRIRNSHQGFLNTMYDACLGAHTQTHKTTRTPHLEKMMFQFVRLVSSRDTTLERVTNRRIDRVSWCKGGTTEVWVLNADRRARARGPKALLAEPHSTLLSET